MKRVLLYIMVVMPLALLQGCDDFLNIQPKGYTIPSK